MPGMCTCNSSQQFLLCDAFHQGLIAQDVLLLAGCKKANDYGDHQRKWRVLNHLDLLTFCCNCNCTPGRHGFGQTLVGLWRVDGERDQLNTENLSEAMYLGQRTTSYSSVYDFVRSCVASCQVQA